MKNVNNTAIVLLASGKLHHQALKDDANFDALDGRYYPDATGRFWNPEPIPQGWVQIFAQSNPQPVGARTPEEGETTLPAGKPIGILPPKGFWAEELKVHTGGFWPTLFSGGLGEQGKTKWDLKRIAIIAAAALAGLGIVGYFYLGWFH